MLLKYVIFIKITYQILYLCISSFDSSPLFNYFHHFEINSFSDNRVINKREILQL